MSYQVLARKWRPANFHQLVGQEHVKKALITALDAERLHHAYLFTGTRGVGKTTIARILSKCLNCDKGISSTPCGSCGSCTAIAEGRFVDLIEVDAASRTKVDDTRELLDNVQYRPTEGRYKVYLIDEVHMLSTHSFNALLKTLEEPPPHVIFLLATTDPQKLPVTVLSRCLQFHLRHMSEEEISHHLAFLLGEEKVEFETPALELLAAAADGSMRDGLSLLDQAIAHGGGTVTETSVKEMLGTVEREPIWQLFDNIIAQNDEAVFSSIESLSEFSNDFLPVLEAMLHALHQLAVAQKLPLAKQQLSPQANDLAEKLSAEDLQLFYQIVLHGRRDLPLASSSRMGFEMTILRLLAFQPAKEISAPAATTQKKTELKTEIRTEQKDTQATIVATVEVKAKATHGEEVAKETVEETASEQKSVVEDVQLRYQGNPSEENATILESNQKVESNELKQPQTNSEVVIEKVVSQKALVSAGNWADIASSLELDGMARQMMINSRFVSVDETELILSCQNLLPQALTSERQQQIDNGVSAALGFTVKVCIEAVANSEGEGESAMEVNLREKSERQQQAEESIKDDSLVKDMIAKFDATIREGSVVPITDS